MRQPTKPRSIYIPISPENVKISVEVPVKHRDEDSLMKIEKQGTKNVKIGKLKTRRIKDEMMGARDSGLKTVEIKKTRKNRFSKVPGTGNILIITEKPQAALKIASALGNARKYSESGAPFYELERDGKKIIVACAVGHLFGLKQARGEKGWPVFKIEWVPEFEKNPWAKKYYTLLSKLVRRASQFIVATDYDIEGEVIGYNILRFIAKQEDAKRMKFSTLTKNELENAYENLMPTIDWGQAIAGETRHYLDWMYGINLSRALMEAIKTTGAFRIMSIGRVQGPALHFIVEREKEIQAFVPEPYWQVFITVKGLELKYIKDLTSKEELAPFQNLTGKTAELETEKSEQAIKPPAPFDLTTLQTEAYKFFGINPAKTLQIAQRLYLAGIISYPRTSSQKIPPEINPKAIIKRLGKGYETSLCTRNQPIEGSKSDPAHPSIYPTGEISELEGEESKIYDLITRRFLACFCEDATVANKTITAMVGEFKFLAKGLVIIKKGWMEMYKARMQEKEIPDLQGTHVIEDSRIEEKETQPPKRYTPASLVSELAKRNLGTKATRAAIIETLYNRGYIKDQSIRATPIGIALIETLEKHCPIIIDEQLTRKYEEEMDSIQDVKKNPEEREEKVIQEAKETINKIAVKFRKEEKEIGKELMNATNDQRQQERKENELTVCEKCGKNNLRIMYNKMGRRYFVACSGYPECRNTYSLPPNSLIKPSKTSEGEQEICPECKFPLLLAIRKAKRPWKFCFNPICPSRKQQEQQAQEKEEAQTEETETNEE